jgi:hypothetical protein
MCIRHTYFCHSCCHCFDILELSSFCLKFDKFTHKYLCCYIQRANIVVERLCSDDNCLCQTEEGALAGVGGSPLGGGRCCGYCQAKWCRVEALCMPCVSCWRKNSVVFHTRSLGYFRPHRRVVQSDLPFLSSAPTCALRRRRHCSPGLAAALAEKIEKERKKKLSFAVSSQTSPEVEQQQQQQPCL